jgi:serine/threonine protein kinase
VYKGLQEGVHEVAIKVLVNSLADLRKRQTFMREVELLKSCRHSHIVQVIRQYRLPSPLHFALSTRVLETALDV